jgi:hypothetical protein
MAQKIHIVLTDDLDGSEATETVAFSLDGTAYEIDLNDDNADSLRTALAPYVGHARKVSSRVGRPAGRGKVAATSGPSAADVRSWAKENGHSVPERGRIPGDVRAAFDAAN